MRALLDVNFVLALIDPDHIFHQRTHEWWSANHDRGWASCPITENGFVRILSRPNYSQTTSFLPHEAVSDLRDFAENTDHEFWPDRISILDSSVFDANRIIGPKQITDIYLLALAVKNNGCLVTLDQRVPLSAVKGAKGENLCVI